MITNSNINFFIFSPILEKLCTLQELQTFYSIDDLADMNEALSIKNKYLEKAYLKQLPQMGNTITIDGGCKS